ncbi:hypothetical protein BDF21DRAFT_409794 [Thamnidium elegans]|uniref:Uncharacterized protein n=1 Tax=Thamnidium elegans TaxID=101142 RepID=A0A8H7SJL9_9FUNG|nr:hypothetical protein INT48_008015 [Thamnidium elegans]KAI8091619.1 hypothetical protein BDF21DRAFT_409794 [Thamnidium elegans]
MKFLLWLIPLFICLSVQARYATDTKPLLQNQSLLHLESYQQKWTTHTDRVKRLVTKVRSELKSNNNIRLTTEYTMTDIIFFLKRYLPTWVYPPSAWKQDPITRRRNIARTVRSSPLASRPRYVALRDEMIEWTKTCNQNYYNHYAVDSIDGLESLIDSMLDFVAVTTDKELMNPVFLSTGFATLNKAIHNYIEGNNQEFLMITKEANDQFNTIATLAGELRIPLESMREDAISQTKYIRDELFEKVVYGLHHLAYTIQTNIETLASELVDADETTSEALRKHTADTIHSELLYFENIEIVTLKLKSVIAQVWKNATNELAQSPFTAGYWIDVTTEVKEAFAELARLIAIALRSVHKRKICSCSLKL